MSRAHLFKHVISKSCKHKRISWNLDKAQTKAPSKLYCTKETVRKFEKAKDSTSILEHKDKYLTSKSVKNLLNFQLAKLTQDGNTEKKEDKFHNYTEIRKSGQISTIVKHSDFKPTTSHEYFCKNKPDENQTAEISVFHIKEDKEVVDNNEPINVTEYSTVDDKPTFVDKIMELFGFRFTMIQSPNIDASNYDVVIHTNTTPMFGDMKDLEIKNTVSFSNNESLRQNLKSNQEAGFGVNVLQCTDNDFESLINDSKPTIVMFYASWCGNCATIKPAFSKLATTLKSEGSGKAIAIDASINPKTADFAHVEIIPTFKLYKSGKEVAVYNGDRSFDDFLNFVKTN